MTSNSSIISVDCNQADKEVVNLSAVELCSVFELDRCRDWIVGNGFKNVCLQFPVNLLSFCADVSSWLEAALGFRVYILADESYGSCCVDEVGAKHIGADAVIHFGHSCLSTTIRMPVLYIFDKKPVDVSLFVSCIKKTFPDPAEKILLLYDVAFKHAIGPITKQLSEDYPHLIVPGIATDEESHGESHSILGRIFKLEEVADIDNYKVVFLGPEGRSLETLLRALAGCRFYVFDPAVHDSIVEYHTANFYKKRMYLIEKVKHARTLGILIGTLSIAGCTLAIDRIKKLAKNAGKKCYIISVGKLNVAKLANFPEVEVFVLLACPENSLVDTKEYFQPIVTMHEVELALNSEHQWTAKHITDFSTLLPGGSNYFPEKDIPDDFEFSQVSLIDGQIHHFQRFTPESGGSPESSAVSLRGDTTVSNHPAAHDAGSFYRSWTGLEQNLGMTSVSHFTSGRKGIPQNYTHEPELG